MPLEGRDRSTSFWAFLRAFGVRWFVFMSGPLALPFTFAALFVGSTWLKSLFALLATSCAVFACYWVWRHERQRKMAIQTAQPSYVAPVNTHPYLEILHILDGAAEAWMDGQEDRKELPGRRRGCAAASRHLRLAEAHRGLPGPQVGRPWLSGLMRCR